MTDCCDWCGELAGDDAVTVVLNDETWIICRQDHDDPEQMAALLARYAAPR